jgi:hypothetical protein
MAVITPVQSMNSFATSLDLEFGLGVSLTGTATGTAAISGGVLDMTGVGYKKVLWGTADGNLPLGQRLQFLCRVRTAYTSTPSSRQNFFFTSQLLGIGNNQCYFYHQTSGSLELYITDQTNTQKIYISGNWTPTAGQWYELSFVYDLVAGYACIYVDGVRIANVTGLSYTRLPFNSLFQIGGDGSDNPAHVTEFSMKDMILYHTPVDTGGATRSTGYTMPTLSLATQALPEEAEVESGVAYNYGANEGTFVGGGSDNTAVLNKLNTIIALIS